jgi:serine/threonine protein kinase/WD40 repeat protein
VTRGQGRQWQVGDVILDLYEVLDAVHSGGMGVVHRVRHRGWNIDLAVKTPRPRAVASPRARRHFEEEAGTWVDLGLHPHTVNCAYVRTLDGLPRVFAEWVDGGSLADAVAGGRLYEGGPGAALARVLDVAVQTAWGLRHAHDSGLVHQDVKPANVMLEPDATAKVTDFGLARALPEAGPADAEPGGGAGPSGGAGGVTYAGMTRAYRSPEQAAAAAGRRDVRLTPATDVWSWALTVLTMFAGRVPAPSGEAGAEALELLLATGPDDPRPPAVPPAVAGLLRQCLVASPAARPQLGELARVLADLYGELTGTPYPRPVPRAAALLADGLSNQALSMLDLGRPREAVALWGRAVTADPGHLLARYNQGLHLWRTAAVTDQELLATVAAARDPDGDGRSVERLLGFVHLERGDPERSATLLRAAAGEDRAAAEAAEALAEAERRPGLRPVLLTDGVDLVTAVAVSADGRRVLSGDHDGRLRLWDAEHARCLRELTARGARVTALAVDAAATVALVGREQGPPERWDLVRGERLPLPGEPPGDTAGGRPGDAPDAQAGDAAAHGTAGPPAQAAGDVAGAGTAAAGDGGPDPAQGAAVTAVAVSGDGADAAAGHEDGGVRLWFLAGGRAPLRVRAHAGAVRTLALDAAGAVALSAASSMSRDQAIAVWDTASGRRGATLAQPADERGGPAWGSFRYDGAFSPDAGHALQIWDEGPMVLWDRAAGRAVAGPPHHLRHVGVSALAPGGALAVVGAGGAPARVWEPRTGRCLHTFGADAPAGGDPGPVSARAAGDAAGAAGATDAADGRDGADGPGGSGAPSGSSGSSGPDAPDGSGAPDGPGTVGGPGPADGADGVGDTTYLRCAAVSGDGRTAVLGLDGAIRVQPMPVPGYRAPWAYARPRAASEVAGHEARFRARMAQAREFVAAERYGRAARSLRAAEAVPGFARHPDLRDAWRLVGRHGRRAGLRGAWPLFDLDGQGMFPDPLVLAAGREGAYFATVRLGGPVDAWDAADGRLLHEYTWDVGSAGALHLTADDTVAVVHDDVHRTVHLLDLVADCAYPLSTTGRVSATAVSPEVNCVLTGEIDGRLRWCDMEIRRERRTVDARWDEVPAHRLAVAAVALGEEARFGASRAATRTDVSESWYPHDDELCLWSLDTGERVWRQDGRPPGLSLAFSPDSGTLFEYGAQGLWAFDVPTGRPLYAVDGVNNHHVLAVTRDSSRAVTADHRSLTVFDTATGRVLRSIADAGETLALALSHDGRYAVAGVRGRRLRVWDLASGRLLRTLEGHRGDVHTLVLSTDGHRLVSGDSHGTVRGWELAWDFDVQDGEGDGPEGRG